MASWKNAAPTCTTQGDYVDDETMCRNASTPPGPVCIEGSPDPIPEPMRRALDDFESTAINFASRFIPDHPLRLEYMAKIKAMSESVMAEFRAGSVTAEEGAWLAHIMRNHIMETTRGASSDVGRAWAKQIKAQGKNMVELQEKYATELFQREFAVLGEAERNQVFLEIINASGRANPSVLVKSARLAGFAKGLLFVTAAIAVYQVATSDRPGREAVKQGTVIGVGAGAGALIGAAAATSLVCGPGAPVCVGIFVFVGGGLAAFGADSAFDQFWK